MMPAERLGPPVRIEVGTSEIEGGQCRAWADPTLAVAAVAMSYPEDAFTRILEPRLANLDRIPGVEGMDDLPPALRGLLARLKETHVRLYQDNRSLRHEPSWIDLACAVAEEDRLYFVRTSPAWICLLRDGKAIPAERGLEDGSSARTGLGSSERLRLEVTSMAIEPGDTVVLLSSESTAPPDLRAMARLFAQSNDLKRVCDGIVNLQGLQAQGASAVAIRFVPIHGAAAREDALAGLLDWGGVGDSAAAPLTEARASEPAHLTLAPRLDEPTPIAEQTDPEAMAGWPETPGTAEDLEDAGEDWHFPWEETPPARTSPEPVPARVEGSPTTETVAVAPSAPMVVAAPSIESAAPVPVAPAPAATILAAEQQHAPAVAAAGSAMAPEVAPAAGFPPSASVSPEAALAGSHAWPTPTPPDSATATLYGVNAATRVHRSMQVPLLITIVVALITLILILLAAVPGFRRALTRGAAKPVGHGQLWIEPSVSARHVYLDGVEVAQSTPARLDAVGNGRHRVRLDLGAAGAWEGEVEVTGKAPVHLAPKLTGSVEVLAADPSRGGQVWVQGRGKVAVPARLDSLPLGWTHLLYEDQEIALWDRPVLVRAGQPTRVVLPNHLGAAASMVSVESLVYEEGKGLGASAGDSVFIDHEFRGRTPYEEAVEPGLHSVRVSSKTGEFTDLVDLRAGGMRYVPAQFGLVGRPRLRHSAPGRVLAGGPIALMVEISAGDPSRLLDPRLHLPEAAPGRREVAMAPVEGSDGTYAGLVDPADLQSGRELRYYFSVVSGGETVYSDLFELDAQRAPRVRTSRASLAATQVEVPPAMPPDEPLDPVPSQP